MIYLNQYILSYYDLQYHLLSHSSISSTNKVHRSFKLCWWDLSQFLSRISTKSKILFGHFSSISSSIPFFNIIFYPILQYHLLARSTDPLSYVGGIYLNQIFSYVQIYKKCKNHESPETQKKCLFVSFFRKSQIFYTFYNFLQLFCVFFLFKSSQKGIFIKI